MADGKNARSRASAERRRRDGGLRGGESVRATFATAITRRRFAELVEIGLPTVRRWELAGLINPRREVILGSPTCVFGRSDVEFGRRLIALLRARNGELSLEQAADAVRAKRGR